MVQLIAFITFIVSMVVMAGIVSKKIPVLATLPKNGHHGLRKPKLFLKVEKRIKEFHFEFFHKQVYLHKLLSKIRIWVLKLERKIGELLHGMRKKSQELEKELKKKKSF